MRSMIFKNWIGSKRGVGVHLAMFLKVPPSFVSKMASGEKPIPIAHMAAIEAFTKGEVTRQEMCPDRWQDIWPELIQDRKDPAAQQIRAQAAPNTIAPSQPQEPWDGVERREVHTQHIDAAHGRRSIDLPGGFPTIEGV